MNAGKKNIPQSLQPEVNENKIKRIKKEKGIKNKTKKLVYGFR